MTDGTQSGEKEKEKKSKTSIGKAPMDSLG
jgi:hypothetical protein